MATQSKPRISYNRAENAVFLTDVLNQKRNIFEQRHLEKDGKSVKVVSDGFIDRDKEIQSELKNAGLQNILKLQEMRYGTLDNAIARAEDKGVYADVSKIPDNVGDTAAYVAAAQAKLNALAAELGVDPSELSGNLTADKLAELYQKKNSTAAAPTGNNEGGQE